MAGPGAAVAAQCEAPSDRRLGLAWVALSASLALHVADEALTGFLGVYNPTVLALRESLAFFPMPTFTFAGWLIGLIALVLAMFALAPLAYRNAPWMRSVMYFAAVVAGILNALGHTIGTILGHTVSTVRFSRPAPGFYSSPLLFAVGVWLIVELRRTHPRDA